jgi:transposase
MLEFAPSVRVYLACKAVDMRRGFDGLAAHAAQTLRRSLFGSGIRGLRQARRLREDLIWDGSGPYLFAKRPQ